jgi:hypothetical protein
VGRTGNESVFLGSNFYQDGVGYKYVLAASNYASMYQQASGQHIWSTAAAGTSGNAISFTQAMLLDAAGSLQIKMPAAMGYGTGSGGTVTQATSRTTGVTINKPAGSITLVSAAGSTTWQTFTVTNSTVAVDDSVHVVQRSGTDKYQIYVTNVAAGSFQITFATTGGTTTEQPVFNFSVMKGAIA